MALFGDDGRYSLNEDLRLFAGVAGIAEFFGVLSIILMCAWLSTYYEGFSVQDSNTKFNLHPLLMTFGFVFLFGNGIIIYRVFRRIKKIRIKIAHAGIQIICFFIAVIGIKIAWDGHDEDHSEGESKHEIDTSDLNRYKRHAGHESGGESGGAVHMASLHTWIGLITVILFIAQWVIGLVTFLYPQLRPLIRQAYMPLHVFWGGAIFVMAALSALSGIVMFSTRYDSKHKLSQLNGEAWLINILGLTIIAYVISVLFILFQSSYKRKPTPEEEDKIPLASSNID